MAHQQRENPPRWRAAGSGNLSCLENIDGPELSPIPMPPQEESAAATAPGLLDLNYLNVEPAPLACLLEEIAGDDPRRLRCVLARYARLAAEYGALIAAYGGERFPQFDVHDPRVRR